MEANKLRIETDWQTLKNSLLIQNETNHAQEESDLPNVFGDERQWSPENIGKSGHSSSKSKLRHAIAKLEADHAEITEEHIKTLNQLKESQQQVETLRSELEHLRVESELSKNCIEDLRVNSTLMMENRDEMERKIVHVQSENLHITNEHACLLASLDDARQQNEQLDQMVEALRSELERMRVEAELSRNCLEDLRNNSNWQRQNQTVVHPQPAAQSIQTRFPLQQAASSAFMPVANTIREAFQYAQPEHDPNEAAILGDITRASQQVASYLQYQSERFSSGQFVRQQTQLFSTDCQTDTPNIQDSPTQTEQVDDVRERILWLEEVVGQKDIAINALTEERDHLNRLYSDLHNVYSELQRNATENTQSETFRASINELQHNIDILTNERNSLQVELDSQKSQLQEEISNLRHQVVQLSAESSYNAQIANERDYFRQQLVELQTHLGSQPVLINADFSQQFEVALSTIEQSTQTTSQSEETKKAILSENSEVLPQFSANAMTRVVQEQREILQACIEESVQMESYMSTGVEHLMALNSELEQCAESIKAQVYALNQQIARELTEQISENLESGRLVSNEQMEQLRSELAATRAENELNLQRIEQFENSHRMLQKTYEDLIERYTILQESFEELQKASAIKAESEEKSTDALLDGSTIDRICDLNATIEEMSIASGEARNQLNEYQQRLQSLQMLMSTQLNSTHDKLKELKSEEFTALKSSVVASISEFKLYLLHSFGQLQHALETTRDDAVSTLVTIPDEASMRRELENTERVSRALVLCEKICRDIEEDSKVVNEHATSSACLETMLNKIHSHWRKKQEELAEKARALNEQRNLSNILEGRLNEAEAQLNLIQSRSIDSSAPSMLTLSANNIQASDLHLAIMAARLTTKECDNNALFRCNSELAKTNVELHAQVEHLQDCVQRVSDELDAVTNSISSNSRQSSLASLNVKQDEQEHYSPPRRRVESDGSNREQLSIVNEDEDSFVETNLDASLRSNDMESFVESRVNIKESASSTSTVLLTKSKKSQTKKKELPVQTIEEDAWEWRDEPAVENAESQNDDWGWKDEEDQAPQTSTPKKNDIGEDWGWNDKEEPKNDDDGWTDW